MDQLFKDGLAPSTQRAYEAGKRRYRSFCADVGQPPLPATEQSLCRFVAKLEGDGLAHSTIKSYLSAVRHLHLEERLRDPRICDMARLEQVLRGVKISQAKRGKQGGSRLPISVDILEKLRAAWATGERQDSTMLWAAAALCFFRVLEVG